MYSVSRKNWENTVAPVNSEVTFDAESVRMRKIRIGSSGAFERSSMTTNADEQRGGGREQADRLGREPAVLACVRQDVDEQHHAGRDRRRAGDVEVAVVELGAALAQEPEAGDEHGDPDRDVDEEDPRPAEDARQDAAEQHAGGAAAAGDGAPDAESGVALTAFGEDRRQERERGGSEQRGAEALQRAEHDQRGRRPGKAVEQRAGREQGEPEHEHPLAPEQVGHAAAEQEGAAEEDRVDGDHPLQARLAEPRSILIVGSATFTIATSSTTMN